MTKINDKQGQAIYNCLEQIVQVLCYQPDIPQVHKVDLFNALGKVAESYYSLPTKQEVEK